MRANTRGVAITIRPIMIPLRKLLLGTNNKKRGKNKSIKLKNPTRKPNIDKKTSIALELKILVFSTDSIGKISFIGKEA